MKGKKKAVTKFCYVRIGLLAGMFRQDHSKPLTVKMCSSRHWATTADMRAECSCAMTVKFVMIGFELNVRAARCPLNMSANALGSVATVNAGLT